MVQQDTPGTSDVPKRSSLLSRYLQLPAISRTKKFIYIVLPLVLINAGIAHLILNQVALSAGAAQTEVKDQTSTVSNALEVVSTEAEESSITEDSSPVITTYIVKKGDTLSGIADKFGITVNTIRFANNLTEKTSKISIGDDLVILPVSGLSYTVKKGDTLSGIATKFDADQADILKYNDIEKDAIKVGTELIIPGAEPIVVKVPTLPAQAGKKTAPVLAKSQPVTPAQKEVVSGSTKSVSEEKKENKKDGARSENKVRFVNPMPKGVLTQRIHDGNAVDFGAPVGTPVVASAAGTVLIAKRSGYNGGYGNYIVINHADSSQTLYAHLSKVTVSVGDTVAQGEGIALSGNSGRSTGPHLHYKESNTGKKNTFVNLPLH